MQKLSFTIPEMLIFLMQKGFFWEKLETEMKPQEAVSGELNTTLRHLERPLQQRGGVAVPMGGHMEIRPLRAAPVEVGGHPVHCQSCDRIILVGRKVSFPEVKFIY